MIPVIHFGGIAIPSFFVVISVSLSFLVLYLSHRVELFQMDRKNVFDLALILMISGFIGGRLMHVFYEEWPYYQKDPIQIFYFWQGGFVFFGGFFSGLASTWLCCRLKKINFLAMADFFAVILSLSHALGRVGCVLSGCCYGASCALPWAIDGRHPTALYLMLGEFLIYFYLLFFEKYILKLNRAELTGSIFIKWVLLHSLLRLFVENFRDDFRGAFYQIPLLGHVSVSQLISLLLVFVSLVYFSILSARMKKLGNYPTSSQ